jgi:hypothetical protein
MQEIIEHFCRGASRSDPNRAIGRFQTIVFFSEMVLVGKVQLLFRHDIARHFSLDVLGRGVETRTSSLGGFFSSLQCGRSIKIHSRASKNGSKNNY